ncbi:MAG TPA: glycosyltransferase family 4 protein [Gaiellaceae bacterium]|nr:glycosyltransferase family 4 protein [Gaiellaceae bacterium]
MAVTARVPGAVRPRRRLRALPATRTLRIAVFTTSYPRHEDDFAGRFVSDAVARLQALGHEVEVVRPGVYRDFGLAYDGRGIMANVRRRPWLAPLLFLAMARALRRAAKDADLVHAHWLAGGVVAAFCGKPFVVTLHGSISGGFLDDFRLCERHPRLVRAVLRRARAVICVSEALTEAAARAGVEHAVFIPNGIGIPERVRPEAEPLEVLYTGRLSPEKGVQDLAAAADGLNLVVCGDGPLRDLVPTRGFVSREELERRFEDAAVVVCPSRSEGFGVVCGEAMAHGKPVVACATGGLVNLVRDGETGLLVEPGDVAGLRAAIERLLGDAELRHRLGAAARERIVAHYSWESVIRRTLEVYEAAVPPRRGRTSARRPAAAVSATP